MAETPIYTQTDMNLQRERDKVLAKEIELIAERARATGHRAEASSNHDWAVFATAIAAFLLGAVIGMAVYIGYLEKALEKLQ